MSLVTIKGHSLRCDGCGVATPKFYPSAEDARLLARLELGWTSDPKTRRDLCPACSPRGRSRRVIDDCDDNEVEEW